MRNLEAGFSLLEATVALVILAVLLMAVLPYLTPKPMNLRADTNDLVANLRLARELSISRTTHYRLCALDERTYVLRRREWDETQRRFTNQYTDERRVALRENIRFVRGGGGGSGGRPGGPSGGQPSGTAPGVGVGPIQWPIADLPDGCHPSVEFDSRGKVARALNAHGGSVTGTVQFTLEDVVRGERRSVSVASTGGIWEQ